MSTNKKYNILFIKQEKSLLNADTQVFTELFNKVDKASTKEEAQSLMSKNEYDMIIADITVNPEAVVLLKEMKDKNSQQTIFALLSPKDTDKLYKIANFDINAFELTPDQFDLALESMADFDPYQEQ